MAGQPIDRTLRAAKNPQGIDYGDRENHKLRCKCCRLSYLVFVESQRKSIPFTCDECEAHALADNESAALVHERLLREVLAGVDRMFDQLRDSDRESTRKLKAARSSLDHYARVIGEIVFASGPEETRAVIARVPRQIVDHATRLGRD